jgi:O-antigen/teichoic acid export membrane protein
MGILTGLAMTILLTRTLGIDGYGTLAFVLAIVTLIQTATTLGLPGGTARMLAFVRGKKDEEGAKRIFNAGILVGAASAFVGVGIIVLLQATGAMEKFEASTLLVIASPLLIATGVRATLYGGLRAYQDMKALFVASLVVPLFDIIGIGILVLLGVREVTAFALALVVAAYLEVVLLTYFIRRGRKLGSVFDTHWSDAKALLAFSMPFILVQFMMLVIHQSDIVMLGAFHPASVVGLYAPVMRLGSTVEKLLAAFSLLYLPTASAYFATKRLTEIHKLYQTVTKWAYLVGFGVILALLISPGLTLGLLFGGAYTGMVAEARILAIGYWAALMTGLNGVTLGALGLQKKAAAAALAGAILNLGIGFLLIPRFGSIGAAWSNTIAYIFINCVFSAILYLKGGLAPFRRDTLNLVIYSAGVAAVGLTLDELLPFDGVVGGLGLLMTICLVWVLGAAFGKPFNMEWTEIRQVFMSSRKARESKKSSAGTAPAIVSEPAPADAIAAPVFPIFVGRGRSGTTLFRAIFDSHPRLTIPPESPFLVSLARRRRYFGLGPNFNRDRFVAELIGNHRFHLWELDADEVRAAIDAASPGTYSEAIRALYSLYAAREGKSLYGDKSPRTTGAIALMADLFPEARFIHIVRDGRDVALSHLDVSFGADSVVQAALDWSREVGGCRRAGLKLGPSRYREVRYEDLVDRPEDTVRDLCDFIGIEFDEEMLRYNERADTLIKTTPTPGDHAGLHAPPTKGMRNWRDQMDPEAVTTFEMFAGGLLGDLGYEVTGARLPVGARIAARREQLGVVVPRRMGRMRNHEYGKRLLHRLGVSS